jgi:thioredoxin 1
MATKSVTDKSFHDDVIAADGPVLVDFWAEWCGPCRMIGPALEEISEELGGKVTIAKLNIDENPDAPSRYGVRGIPTMILFKSGAPAATMVGASPKSQLNGWIEGEIYSARLHSEPFVSSGGSSASRTEVENALRGKFSIRLLGKLEVYSNQTEVIQISCCR